VTAILYGFRPEYVPTFAGVSLILLTVAALACFIPARLRRASIGCAACCGFGSLEGWMKPFILI